MTEFPPEGDPPASGVEVLCVGETMVMVTPASPGALTDPETPLRLSIGGAESNVAMSLAQFGIGTGWWSRLSDDPLGRFVHRTVAEHGVDVDSVQFDGTRNTGLYLKDQSSGETVVTYYREGSAAASMSPDDAPSLPAWSRLLHLSGITAAISASAGRLLDRLLEAPRTDGRRISFDINYRSQLWSAEEAGPRLLGLASKADIVFVGLDEAHRVWGVDGAAGVRKLLPAVPQLVVKDGPRTACVYLDDELVKVPTPQTAVTEVVGAGDAFAAGYLAADLRGLSPRRALMAGHLAAREAIQITADVPRLPPFEELLTRCESFWPAESQTSPDSRVLVEES